MANKLVSFLQQTWQTNAPKVTQAWQTNAPKVTQAGQSIGPKAKQVTDATLHGTAHGIAIVGRPVLGAGIRVARIPGQVVAHYANPRASRSWPGALDGIGSFFQGIGTGANRMFSRATGVAGASGNAAVGGASNVFTSGSGIIGRTFHSAGSTIAKHPWESAAVVLVVFWKPITGFLGNMWNKITGQATPESELKEIKNDAGNMKAQLRALKNARATTSAEVGQHTQVSGNLADTVRGGRTMPVPSIQS